MAAYSDLRSVTGATDASLDFLASHPNAPQRIELAQRHARQFGAPGIGARDRDSFLAGIDGLLFGDTPEEGYVRGTTFLHPGLGISFAVPQGFVIDNSAAAVTATGPGDTAIRFDGVAIDRNIPLADYVKSGWVAGLEETSVRSETINGNEAAIARAQAEGWQFDITVIRAGGQVYRLLTAAPVDSATLDSVAQFVGVELQDAERVGEGGAEAAAHPRRHRSAGPDRRVAGGQHESASTASSICSGCSTRCRPAATSRPATRSRSSPTDRNLAPAVRRFARRRPGWP